MVLALLWTGCSQVLEFDQDYTLGTSSATGGAGGGTASGTATGTGTGTGGTGTGCPDDQQDNDHDGTCEPACTAETCSGNGTCDDSSGIARCDCEERFGGDTCADCAPAYEGTDCLGCAAGYQDRDDDGTCLPACADGTCSGHGTCSDTSGAATCRCRPDYQGDDCATAGASGTAGASCEFRIIFGLDIPAASGDWGVVGDVPYDVNEAGGAGAFDRVAYRLILDDEEVWVEMDPFAGNAAALGMPMDIIHDAAITNVTVTSFAANQASISTPSSGNVEMWSNCYSEGLNDVYDYDDDITVGSPDCYGCVQVHVNMLPVLCFNRWSQAGNLDIGIGPAPVNNPDWTFADNAGNFTTRRLEVYIREL